ncbi:MAG: POTRA domain-containing protein, partial [Thiogranum sp.]
MRLVKPLFVIACFACAALAHAAESIDVKITGIEDELLDNVTAQLGIAQLVTQTTLIPLPSVGEPETEVTEASVRSLHRAAPAEIRKALQPFGYYSPIIKSSLERADNRWLASYQIDPDEPTLVEDVELGIQGDGQDNADLRKVLESTQLAT